MVKVRYITPVGASEITMPVSELLRFVKRHEVTSIELTEFLIEKVDRYWFYCGRNCKQFVETTYWYNPITLEREERSRTDSFFPSDEYRMPEWCKGITEHRKSLDTQYY